MFLLATVPALALAVEPVDEALVDDTAADTAVVRGLAARYRYLILPSSVLNPWYYPSAETRLPRPGLTAHVIGAEFLIDPKPASFSVWAEGWTVKFDDGYWDDVESPVDHNDGDWLAPAGLGMLALGANAGNEWAVTPDDKPTWLGFHLSAGLGLGIPWGHVDQWLPGLATEPLTTCSPELSSDARKDLCPADKEANLPPVVPILDLTLAWRVHIAERGLVRIEGGLHDLPYFGISAGATL